MPNRIIKESICYSDDIDKLTPFEETVFYRLLVRVDDYGRIDARPSFLKSMLYVTKKGITEKNIEDAVSKLASVGLVQVYEVAGKPFLLFPKWSLHQRIRNSKEKYPSPEQKSEDVNSRQVAASCGELPPKSESESESEEEKSYDFSCAELSADANTQRPIVVLLLNDKTEYPIFEEQLHKWAELYPAVDILQQMNNMKGWLEANPTRRKTKKGIMRFINSWLAREQDKGGTNRASHKESKSGYKETVNERNNRLLDELFGGDEHNDRPKLETFIESDADKL